MAASKQHRDPYRFFKVQRPGFSLFTARFFCPSPHSDPKEPLGRSASMQHLRSRSIIVVIKILIIE